MLDWQTLVLLPESTLAQLDIAAVNWACGRGLPGCDSISPQDRNEMLNMWASQCRRFTERVMPMFHSGRCDYPDSEP